MTSISVVVPTFNSARTIGACLDSILRALSDVESAWEIVVVDNFSSDTTLQIVSDYKNSQSRIVVKSFSNHGCVAASRNEGVRISRGYYIAFVDSDDLVFQSKFKKQLREMKNADVSYHLVHCSRDSASKRFASILFAMKWRRSRFEVYGPIASTSSIMLTKNIFISVGGFSEARDLIAVEDFELWLRLERAGARFSLIECCLGAVIPSDGSLSKERSLRSKLSAISKHCYSTCPEQVGWMLLMLMMHEGFFVCRNASFSAILGAVRVLAHKCFVRLRIEAKGGRH